MKTTRPQNSGAWFGVGLIGVFLGALAGWVANADLPSSHPAITSIQLDGMDVVVSAHVPPGLKKVTLQSSRKLGTGTWEPRSVLRLDGAGGEITFRLRRSPDLEMVRVRADDGDSLPSFFFQGTNSFPGVPVSSSVSNPGGVAVTMGQGTGAVDGGGALVFDNRAAGTTPAAVSRDVVESDIWQIRGDTLYFFNQYRGLQVIDLANIDAPAIRGTLMLPAVGEQMYVLPDQRLALLARNGCGWTGDSASQVLIVDAGAGDPTVVTSLPVNGQIQESRLVGTALYVLAQTYQPVANSKDGSWEWGTSVLAFDLSDSAAPVARAPLWYSGYGNVLSATDQYLFVSINDASNGSRVRCIDISAPDGTLRQAGVVRAAGNITDKFKMHLSGDVLTVISEKWSWQSPNNTGRWRPVTKLETFSLADPLVPRKLGELELADGEQLHATRFDGDRVYVVTFLRVDPLWVVDLSDPAKPTIRGEVQVPGWSTYIQPFGDRLVTIGIDTTNGWRVAVSLFDVHDPASPALLSKIPLGENSSWSEANSDEKAFGFLPEAGLILVPFSTYSTNEQHGVQLIDLSRDSLAKRGFIGQDLQARRSMLHRDRIVSVSGRDLLSVDASDRDKPVVRGELELAWGVNRLFLQGGHLLEIETSSLWEANPTPAVRVASAVRPDRILNALSLSNLPILGAAAREGRLYLLQGTSSYPGPIFLTAKDGSTVAATNSSALVCSVIDVSKLPALQLMSSTEMLTDKALSSTAVPVWPRPDLLVWLTQPANYMPLFYAVDVVGGMSMPLRGGWGIWFPYFGSSESRLLAVDVANAAAPQWVSEVTLSNTNGWSTFSKPFVAESSVLLSEQHTETSITATNYFLSTNMTSLLMTNVVTITNYAKVPMESIQTNYSNVTNASLALIKNSFVAPSILLPSAGSPAVASGVLGAGTFHSLALTADGGVWTWGDNDHGQLGDAASTDRPQPSAVPGIDSVAALASGAFHNLALKRDGTVWAWGDGVFGQLGNGAPLINPGMPPMPNLGSSTPIRVLGLNGVISVQTGAWHSLAVQSDGTLWGWGANWAGQLGDGTFGNQVLPVRVSQMTDLVQAAAGNAHSLALRRDGTLWTWGDNASGQLGDASGPSRAVPNQVPRLNQVTAVACGHSHNLALKKDGTVWSWGLNGSGQLGDGTFEDRAEPRPIAGLNDIVSVACGQSHSLALRKDGSVWVWGRGKEGQLGAGPSPDNAVPRVVGFVPRLAAVAGGGSHSLAVSADGTAVYGWGNNDHGQLGSGQATSITNVYVETTYVTLTTWTEETTVALRTNVVRTPQYTTVTNELPVYTSRQVANLNVVDYTAPSTPLVRQPISIPGALQGLSHDGALLYLLGYNLNADGMTDGQEWLHACAYDGVACYLVDSHPLPKEWPHPVVVNEPDIIFSRPAVEKGNGPALEKWTISSAGKFVKVNERKLGSNASGLQQVGDVLAAREDSGLEVFDLTQPDLPLLGTDAPSGCLGWNLEAAAGSRADELWLPLDLYGVYPIPLRR